MLVWLPGAAAVDDHDDVCDDEDVMFFALIIATHHSSPTPTLKNTLSNHPFIRFKAISLELEHRATARTQPEIASGAVGQLQAASATAAKAEMQAMNAALPVTAAADSHSAPSQTRSQSTQAMLPPSMLVRRSCF